jgi:hypothetical protein
MLGTWARKIECFVQPRWSLVKRVKMFEWVGRAYLKFVRRVTVVEWCGRCHWALVMKAQTSE